MRGTRQGSLIALTSTGGVITSAGIVLAATFLVLGTLPLVFLAELGTTVALGVLLDTLIVRSVLVTALNLDLGGEDLVAEQASTGASRPSSPRRHRRPPGSDRGTDLSTARPWGDPADAPSVRVARLWGMDEVEHVVAEQVRPAQVRRSLARAERGAALDVTEATALLAARGEQLDRLCAAAARVRDAGLAAAGRPGVVTYSPKVFIPVTRLCRDRCHYCTFVTTPGQLTRAGQAPYLSPDEILDIARQGAELGCLEALFTLGRPARGPVAGGTPVARRAGLRLDAGVRPGHGGPRARGDRAAAPPQPRRHVVGGDDPAQAGRPVDRDDARDHVHPPVHREGAGALRLSGQGPRRAPAGARGRRPALDPVHHRPAGRHRRGPHRARRDDLRPARGRPALRRRPGGDRPELPGQARHRDAAHRRPRPRRLPRRDRGDPVGPRTAGTCAGTAQPGRPRRVPCPARGRRRRLGRGLPAHARPRQPRASLALARAAAGPDRRVRPRAAGPAHRPPRVRPARRAVARPPGVGARRCAGRRGRPRAPRRTPHRPALAGAGRGVRPPRGPRHRAHRPARRDRHRGPHRRPAQRLRRRLRRLGRRARGGGGDRALRAAPACPGRQRGPRRGGARPRQPLRRARAGADHAPRASCWSRSAGSPTTCAATTVGDDVTYVVNRNINFTNVCYVGCRFCAFAQRAHRRRRVLPVAGAGRRPGAGGVGARRDRGLHAGRHRPRAAGHGVLRHRRRREAARARHARPRVLPDGDRQRRHPHRPVGRGLPGQGPRGRSRHHPRHGRRDPRRRGPLGADQGQAPRPGLDRRRHHGAPRRAALERRR